MKPAYQTGQRVTASDSRILAPIECALGRLQVVPMPKLNTHHLVLTTAQGEELLASHPNGYSIRSLAERMASGNHEQTMNQAEYIVRCAGVVQLAAIKRILGIAP